VVDEITAVLGGAVAATWSRASSCPRAVEVAVGAMAAAVGATTTAAAAETSFVVRVVVVVAVAVVLSKRTD
jgi:hypothetical protein